MSPERWNSIKQLFHSTLAREKSARAAFLNEACVHDPEIRTEVEGLIAAHESDPSFLEQPVSCTPTQLGGALVSDRPWRAATEGSADAPTLTRVGPYEIRQVIAHGGMGVVYEAVQERPHRTVALKVLRQGVASPSALRRFEFESQLLARLSHPGIAQVYAAGTHDDGTAYFAMEYVAEPQTITEHARARNLAPRERLKLFTDVCKAVHYGHQKGVIHRDLKPANILVRPDGTVKVIDFGVARCTDSDIALTTLQTDVGQLIGTLQYMSPEQCNANPLDIDTRTDVYSLGVVLFELLCGDVPYDLSGKPVYEATRTIRETMPRKPGTIVPLLRGDVETIVLKALEKDRQRRYQTAADLAADLERYLAGEPIEAKRNSGVYLLRMFARRHRAAAAVALTFVTLLGVSSVTLAYMYSKQTQLRELAEQREQDTQTVAEFQAAQLAGIDAQSMGAGLRRDILDRAGESMRAGGVVEGAVAGHLADFEQRLAGVNFTDLALRTLEDNIFQRAVEAIDEQFEEQPLVRAKLLQTLAKTLTRLGLFNLAFDCQSQALDLRMSFRGEEHPETLTSLHYMGALHRWMGKLDEAMTYYRRAMEGRRRVLGDEHPATLQSTESVGYVLQWTGRLAESLTYRQRALDGCRRVLGDDHPQTLNSVDAMCSLLMSMRRYDKAEPYCREALDTKRRAFGNDDYRTMISVSNMGVVLQRLGRPEAALPYTREAMDLARRIRGDDHASTLLSINNMGTLLLKMGRLEQAMPYYREALDRRRQALGEDHRDTLTSINNMGHLLKSMGRLEEALRYFAEARDGRRRVLGDDDPDTRQSVRSMARLLREMGRVDEAEQLSSGTSRTSGG